MRSVPRCYREKIVRKSVNRRPGGAVSNDVSAEAEKSPLLEAINRERQVRTQHTEKT
jgi:hypothetical protein